MSIEKIAEQVGHRSSKVTETVYKHLVHPTVKDAADEIDEVFGGILGGLLDDDGTAGVPALTG